MADRIEGITIPIGYDTSEVTKAIKDLNKETNASFSELSKIEKALKFNPENTELMAQKMEVLGNVVEDSKKKLELLKQAQEEASKSTDTKKGQEQYRKLTREIIETESKIQYLTDKMNKVDDTKGPDNLRDDIAGINEEVGKTTGAIGDWGDSFKNLLGAGAIGGVIAGVSQVAGIVSGMVEDAVEQSKNKAIIKFSMNVDDESVAAVQKSIKTVQVYGVDSQEALQGVRKQFLLNKDASDEANESIVKMAGYLAMAYSGLDFNEIIQESNEIADIMGITQEEALGMVDALMKVGFPEGQLDIIAEYGKQLEMAGYNAQEIQAIFKAGVDTGTPNIDQLIDGIKEGRIKLTEFAHEIPEALKPAIKNLGMTEEGFQSLAREVAEGGPKGKKAMETIARAVRDVDDKTAQAQAGVSIYGTLWEEQGSFITDTIIGASEEITTMTGNMDNLNRSMAGIDDEPAIRYKKAMEELNTALMGPKAALAEMATNTLDVLNAAMEGTTVDLKELEGVIDHLVQSGTKNAQQFGYVWAEYEDGRVMVSDRTGRFFRNLTKEEQEQWAERAANLETNTEAITTVHDEHMQAMAASTGQNMDRMSDETLEATSSMSSAVKDFAAASGLQLQDAQKYVGELANKYQMSEEDVITVVQAWGGEIKEFAKEHDKNLADTKADVEKYVEAATSGFEKLNQDSTVSLKEYMKNMKANQEATAKWTENTQILMKAGVSEGIIQELAKLGPEGAAQAEKWVKELEKMNGGALTEFDGLNTKTKKFLGKFSDTYVEGIETAGEAARTEQAAQNYPGIGKEMVDDTVDGIISELPYMRETSKKVSTAATSGLNDLDEKGNRLGKNFAEGVAEGMRVNAYITNNAAKALASKAEGAFKQRLSIQSPSKVMMEAGKNITEGVAIGILDQSGDVEKAMTTLSRIPQEVDWLTNPAIAGDFQRATQPTPAVNNYPSITINNPVIDNPERVRKLAEELYRLQNQRR